MSHYCVIFIGLASVLVVSASGQTPEAGSVKWQEGPSIEDLGTIAQVRVPAGYVFAGANDTRALMEAMQNPTSGTELGFVAPAGLDWFVVFEFDDVGYVRDDEKSTLNPDALLDSIKRGTEASNKERQRRGWASMTIVGWEQQPHYSETTHNLEWAIRGESSGHVVVNQNTRLLGRGGVMRVTLVSDPNAFTATLPKFKELLDGYTFKPGHGYSEYRQGDKLAKYGLTALVVGGATAVAVKTGLFKWLWKGLVIGAIALVAFVKRVFAPKKSLTKPANE